MEACTTREGKAREWARLINEWQNSGQSITQWCEEHELRYSRFLYWKKRLMADQTPPAFVELQDPTESGTGITLQWGTLQIHLDAGFDQSTLCRCIQTLKGLA